MSDVGKRKKMERLVKRANRALLVPEEKATPHDRKVWRRGVERLVVDLMKPEHEVSTE